MRVCPRPHRARSRRGALDAHVRQFVSAVQEGDERIVEQVIRLSRTRPLFAPLAYTVGALAMLLNGLRTLLGNWRLVLVQVLPAVWLWLAMYDLRLHALRGKSFHSAHEARLIPIALAIVAITVAAFFLNAVFAFAVAQPGKPAIGPGFAAARLRLRAVLLAGAVVGVPLAFSATIGAGWGSPWFTLTLGAVVGLMMVANVAVPSRLLSVKKTQSRRDRMTASALGTLLGTVVSAPPYLLGRLGLLMLGYKVLAIPGFLLLSAGVLLQAGATGAVRAIRMSGVLVNGGQHKDP